MTRSLYITLLLMPLLLPALTACTDGTDPLPAPAAHPRFVLQQTVQTRVTYPTDSYTQSLFEEGDVLGAFALDNNNTLVTDARSNARYIVTQEGSNLTLTPEFPQDAFPADASYTYIFYYPYKEGTEFDDVTHLVEADQRSQTWTDADGQVQTTHARYENSDLLWDAAQGTYITTGTNGGLTVNVAMDHAMASIVLEVHTEMMHTDAGQPWAQILNIKSLVAGINLNVDSPDDLTGNYGYAGETVFSQNIYMWLFGDKEIDGKQMHVYRAAIPAQTITNDTEMFRIQTGEGDNNYKTYKAEFTGESISFLPGKYYRFTVTETGLRFAGLIEDLEDGGDHYYEY